MNNNEHFSVPNLKLVLSAYKNVTKIKHTWTNTHQRNGTQSSIMKQYTFQNSKMQQKKRYNSVNFTKTYKFINLYKNQVIQLHERIKY